MVVWSFDLALAAVSRHSCIKRISCVRFRYEHVNHICFPAFVYWFSAHLCRNGSIASPRHRHTFDALIILELAIALLVYLASLFTSSEAQSNFVLVIVTNLLFFIPMRLLILLSAWQWHQQLDSKVRIGHFGLLFLMGWALAGILNHALLLPRLLAYPQQFWFVAYVNYQLLYFVEVISIPMLLLDLLLLRFSHNRITPPKLAAPAEE